MRFNPSEMMRSATRPIWEGRFTRDGYRFELKTESTQSFVNLLRTGAVEFGVTAGAEEGLGWETVQHVFLHSLYNLGNYVFSVGQTRQIAFLSLLIHLEKRGGIAGLPAPCQGTGPNVFEYDRFRLGPLVLKREEHQTAAYQPMFDLLFQCAGIRNAPSLREFS